MVIDNYKDFNQYSKLIEDYPEIMECQPASLKHSRHLHGDNWYTSSLYVNNRHTRCRLLSEKVSQLQQEIFFGRKLKYRHKIKRKINL